MITKSLSNKVLGDCDSTGVDSSNKIFLLKTSKGIRYKHLTCYDNLKTIIIFGNSKSNQHTIKLYAQSPLQFNTKL